MCLRDTSVHPHFVLGVQQLIVCGMCEDTALFYLLTPTVSLTALCVHVALCWPNDVDHQGWVYASAHSPGQVPLQCGRLPRSECEIYKRMTARQTKYENRLTLCLSLALTLTSTVTLSTSPLPPGVHAHRHAFFNLLPRPLGNGAEFSPLRRSSRRRHCQSTRMPIT